MGHRRFGDRRHHHRRGATGQGVCLEVLKNDALLSLDGLGALASCAKGGVGITNNTQLTDISALAKVGALGKDGRGISLELSHLPQLASAGAAFGMLTELPGAAAQAHAVGEGDEAAVREGRPDCAPTHRCRMV